MWHKRHRSQNALNPSSSCKLQLAQLHQTALDDLHTVALLMHFDLDDLHIVDAFSGWVPQLRHSCWKGVTFKAGIAPSWTIYNLQSTCTREVSYPTMANANLRIAQQCKGLKVSVKL